MAHMLKMISNSSKSQLKEIEAHHIMAQSIIKVNNSKKRGQITGMRAKIKMMKKLSDKSQDVSI